MATQNKDQFDTKPQDGTQDNPNKYSKFYKFCKMMTQEMATQPGINQNQFFKDSLLRIEKNPYAIRVIYELINSYIEARANNFDDKYMKKLMDATWRLLNENKRDYKENGVDCTTAHFIRGHEVLAEKIGISFTACLRKVISNIPYNPYLADVVQEIQVIKRQLEEQKSNLDYQKTQQIIEAYNNYVSNKTNNSLKDIITFFIKDSKFHVNCCFEDYVGYKPPPLIAKIFGDIKNDENNDIKKNIDKYITELSQEIKSNKNYTIPYEDYKKQEDKKAIKRLREIFAISEENEKEDLDNLNYNTYYCCGFCKYNTSTLYNKGINTMNNDIPGRYTDYSPPTLCCDVLW